MRLEDEGRNVGGEGLEEGDGGGGEVENVLVGTDDAGCGGGGGLLAAFGGEGILLLVPDGADTAGRGKLVEESNDVFVVVGGDIVLRILGNDLEDLEHLEGSCL